MDNLLSLRPSWCEIDLSAVQSNIQALKSLLGPMIHIYMCLKSDACGCGIIPVATAASKSGVDGFAFGNIDKAIECRQAGITQPILVYPSCLPESASILAEYRLMPTLSTANEVTMWEAALNQPLKIFLKIDSGSFRAGAFPNQSLAAAKMIKQSKWLQLAGVYGHTMGSYGFDSPGYEQEQLNAFTGALADIETLGIKPPIRMISSSATVLKYPEVDLNSVDPGRLLMGINFDAIDERKIDIRPVLHAIKSKLIMVKDVSEETGAPFPPFFKKPFPKKIGLIPFGWGDGYPISSPQDTYVLINGQKAPVILPIHSEIMRIDLTNIKSAAIGDEVTLMGTSGNERIDLSDLARIWGMDHFSIQNAIGQKLQRVYINMPK